MVCPYAQQQQRGKQYSTKNKSSWSNMIDQSAALLLYVMSTTATLFWTPYDLSMYDYGVRGESAIRNRSDNSENRESGAERFIQNTNEIIKETYYFTAFQVFLVVPFSLGYFQVLWRLHNKPQHQVPLSVCMLVNFTVISLWVFSAL